jgi:hypothetical protein
MRKTVLSAPALVIAGAVFVILVPVLGVALWVSLLAAGASAVVFAAVPIVVLAGGGNGPASRNGRGVRMNPVIDVAILRTRFSIMLGLGVVGGFLTTAVYAFSSGTLRWIAFGTGIAVTGAAGVLLALYAANPQRRQLIALPRSGMRLAAWQAMAAAAAAIGAWQIVESLVFSAGTVRWLTFADACALAAISVAALVLHELSTERVVHALEVVEARGDSDAPEVAAGEQGPVHA